MNLPLVSIGMPVYNGELFLAQALDSLLAQSFRDFELIISDNASTDRTQSICESRRKQDPRIRYFRQPANRGPASNFNFVLRQATGKYFMWAAHDDLWDREWVATLLRNFSAGTAISFGHVASIGADGQLIRSYRDLGFTGRRLSRLARYFLADEHHGKANLIYGLHLTDTLKGIGFTTYNGCDFGQDMHVVFDCLQRGGDQDRSRRVAPQARAKPCPGCAHSHKGPQRPLSSGPDPVLRQLYRYRAPRRGQGGTRGPAPHKIRNGRRAQPLLRTAAQAWPAV